MKLLFEKYNYKAQQLLNELGFIKKVSEACDADYDFEENLKDFEVCFKDVPHSIIKEKKEISFSGVGNCYNGFIKDSVYILPKVFVNVLVGINKEEHKIVFGKPATDDSLDGKISIDLENEKKIEGYDPDNIISLEFSKEAKNNKSISRNECGYISDIAQWVYESVLRYVDEHKTDNLVGNGDLVKVSINPGDTTITFVDTIENLKRFYKVHRTLFTFVAVNRIRGGERINWNKTVSKQQAYIQSNKPVYSSFVSKTKAINFDEEVVVMFLSVMNYLRNKYYFGSIENNGYELIKPRDIEKLIESGKGIRVMKKMRHKYFVDEFVQLCDFLLAFFERAYDVASNPMNSEVTLVKKYDRVFEHMIDCLIGDELPKALHYLKNQDDGKNIDHIYGDRDFFDDEKKIFYIGDSKYYKEDSNLGKTPIAKQYTYAKNIIQYSMNIINKVSYLKNTECEAEIKKEEEDICEKFNYFDQLTEGYNITPNFFIQGRVFTEKRDVSHLFSECDLKKNSDDADFRLDYQFKNRLFDRDTLILQTYDMNFLYLLAVYVKRGESESSRNVIRNVLRSNLIDVINSKFEIYRLTNLKTEKSINDFMDTYSRAVAGRVFSFGKENDRYFYIAFGKEENGKCQEHGCTIERYDKDKTICLRKPKDNYYQWYDAEKARLE